MLLLKKCASPVGHSTDEDRFVFVLPASCHEFSKHRHRVMSSREKNKAKRKGGPGSKLAISCIENILNEEGPNAEDAAENERTREPVDLGIIANFQPKN